MRRGWHALQAGKPELALDELADVARVACRGMPELADGCLKLRKTLVEMLEESEAETVKQSLLEAATRLSHGDSEIARQMALDCERRARQLGESHEQIEALRILGREALDRGDREGATDYFGKATDVAESLEDWQSLGRIHLNLGWTHFVESRYDKALASYDLADQHFLKASGQLAAEPATFAAIAHIAKDELELAREKTQQALDLIRSTKDLSLLPVVINNLAEIARFEGRWEAAHQYVEAAAWWRSLTGHRFTLIDDFNRGLVAIGARRFGEARGYLADLHVGYGDAGMQGKLGLVYAAQAAMELAWGDFGEATKRLDLLNSFGEEHGVAHRDIAWSCERGVEIAIENRADALTRRFAAWAVGQYRALGLETRANDIIRIVARAGAGSFDEEKTRL